MFGTDPALPVPVQERKPERLTERWSMTDRQTQERAEESNTIKDPDRWTTGDEPMTGAQRSYLHTLAEEAHQEVPEELTKAEASKLIDELQERTGRGRE
jgi:hypothetical protein